MQSFLQYRRFGRCVQEQLQRHKPGSQPAPDEKTVGSSGFQNQAPEAQIPVDGDETRSESLHEDKHHSEDSEEQEEHEPQPNAQDHGVTGQEIDRPAYLRHSSTRSLRRYGTRLGQRLTGVQVRDRKPEEGGDGKVFVVDFHGDDDPLNPHNWPVSTRAFATINVALIGIVVGWASSIDSTAIQQASAEFHVSKVVESMATGLFLVGFGVGALFAGPLSETFGRNPVYIGTLLMYMIFIMASGLAPNIGAQLAFRWLAGFFGSTPLTCAGGSIADMWDPLERVLAFPVFANAAFLGPVVAPVAGGWIASSPIISWRWTEWITLIFSGLVLALVVLFQPETYSQIILTWKAKHLRKLTGDDRYVSPMEIRQESFFQRIGGALYRPLLMTAQEPIIILIALYLTVVYIVLFTFLDGYDYIFGEIHGTSQGITGTCFAGIAVGLFLASFQVPLIYRMAKKEMRKMEERGTENPKLAPEFRLLYCMYGGSVAIPISLFWMGWTSDSNISIWSPLAASVLFGYGILCVFISCYQYIIDAYETMAASGLASITLIRYVTSGGMIVVGVPFYENLGVHYTLTILACLSALLVPVPYLFYIYGPKIRAMSKYAP